MQESLKRYADDARRSHGVEVQIRVGVNSGEVVVRVVGSDLRMDYTAVGQTTHLAARMEQLAPPGIVRLSGETVRLAERSVEVRSLGPIPVKGLADPIEIFELTGAGTARTRLQAAALRGLTRFAGRDAEVEYEHRWGSKTTYSQLRLDSLPGESAAELLARPLARLTDPLAGFFALRRSTLERAQGLDPVGFKIALELLVRCRIEWITEIPIHFADCTRGDSKLSVRETVKFLEHLRRLCALRLGLRRSTPPPPPPPPERPA
jgi:hypothetical protein